MTVQELIDILVSIKKPTAEIGIINSYCGGERISLEDFFYDSEDDSVVIDFTQLGSKHLSRIF